MVRKLPRQILAVFQVLIFFSLKIFFEKGLYFENGCHTFASAFREGGFGINFLLKRTTVDTLSYKTLSAKKEEVVQKWFVIDADGEVVGRLCSRIAHVLRGKHKPSYTPHVDCGDHIVVINAEKIRFTGRKIDQKEYLRYSGYPGGQKSATPRVLLEKKPHAIIENAVKGMLPKNSLGRQMFRKLHVYAGAEHPHEAQQPEPFKF
jgi:large subunit ribosomal protein L13